MGMLKKGLLLALAAMFVASVLTAQSATGGRSRSRSYEITITSNASGFSVWVDGQGIKGNTTSVSPGNHTIVVRADGYRDWQQTVNITSNTTIRAEMIPDTYSLRVQPNISTAQVYINGRRVGAGSVVETLRPGTYQVRISAPGYIDFSATVRLNSDEVLRASLRPAPATVIVEVPSEIQTPGIKDVISLVKVFLNGRLQPSSVFEVDPGRHTIRITSGGFSVEQTYILDAGRTYRIVPNLTLTITQ